MPELSEQIAEARTNGYSDSDIVYYLGANHPILGPKLKEALGAGYQPTEILEYLKSSPSTSLPSPQQADQITTQTARTIATRAQMTATTTPAPSAPASAGESFASRLLHVFTNPMQPGASETIPAPYNPGDIARGPNFTPAPQGRIPTGPLLDFTALGGAGGPRTRGVIKGVEDAASGLTSPASVALTAATFGLGSIPVVGKLVAAGFGLQQLVGAAKQSPKLMQQIRSGDTEGAWRTGTEMGLSTAMAASALTHAARGGAEHTAPTKPEPTANTFGAELYQPGHPAYNDEALQQALKVEPPGPKRDAMELTARRRGVEVPKLETHEEQATGALAEAAERDAHYNDLFDKADQKMRDRTQRPPSPRKTAPRATVPEEGTAEQVTRVQYARENLARQMEGKPFADLPNSSRLAVDDLIRQGYGQVGEPPELETKPAEDETTSHFAPPNEVEKPEESPALGQTDITPTKPAREPQKPVAYGSDTEVRIPGENRSYKAVYAVRDASDVFASHNPFSFEKNPDYYHVNDRNYAEPQNAERLVKQEAEFDPGFMINDNPTAENGPSIIDQHGNVLGGNSRNMTLSRVRENRPESATAYRQMLEQQAKRFGISPDVVKRMDNPVLVRQLTEDVEPQRAITDFNKTGTAALRQSERAISDSRRLSADTAEYMARRIEENGPDGTLAQALEGTGGREIMNRLVDDGVLTTQDKGGLLNSDGSLTPEGKQRVGRLLSGQFFNSARELEETPPEVRAKLDRAVPSIMRTAQRPEWDLTEATKEAVSLAREAKNRGVPVDDIVRQQGLFGGGNYSEDAIAIARKLEDKPTAVAKAFRQYASEEALSRPDAPMTIGFEPPTREEAFREAFGDSGKTPENSTDNIGEKSEAAHAAIPPDDDLGPSTRLFAGRPRLALEYIRKRKAGIAEGAIQHPDAEVGAVGLPWGKPGDSANDFKHGYGVSHIDAKRGEGYLNKNLERLPVMKVVDRYYNRDGSINALRLSDGEHGAIISKDWKGKGRQPWLLTEFTEDGEPAAGTRIRVPGAPDEGGGPTPPPTGSKANLPPEGNAAQAAGSPRRALSPSSSTGDHEASAPARVGMIAPKGGASAPSSFRRILAATRQWLRDVGGRKGDTNFSERGALKSRFVRNLSQLEEASPKAWAAAVETAGSKSQAAVVMRAAVPKVIADLKGSGINWDLFRSMLVESRLRGARARWYDLADAAVRASDEQLENDFPHYASLLENVEGRRGIAEDARQKAEALLEQRQFGQLRAFIADRLTEAGERVGTVMPPRTSFETLARQPGFRRALATYKQTIERPMARSHAMNEGVFSDALGPLDAYYPLIPLTEERPSFQTGRSTPYRKPKNISNAFATGLGEQYDLGAKALTDRISTALRMNSRAGLIQALIDEGLARKLGRSEHAGDTITIGGRTFTARTVQTGIDRQVFRGGKPTYLPAERALIPDWLASELEPILEKRRLAAPGLVRRILDRVNQFALAGPADAVFHSTNILGSLVANTPYLGEGFAEKTIGNTPITKLFTAVVKIANTDATSPEALTDLAEMARKGMLGDRYARETYSKSFAEQSGASLKRFTLGPLLNGPKGLDVRARLVLYRLAKEMNPEGSPIEQAKFVNQLGNYVHDLQGTVERRTKASGFSPFYTAGSTMLRNGINAWTGQGPIPKSGPGLRVAQQLSGGAAGLVSLWALAYRASTGKWPWGDDRAKFLEIPVSRSIRESDFGRSMWGPDLSKDGYVRFAYFDPIVERGARALGIEGGANALMRGGTAGQAFEHGLQDTMNSAAAPFTTGPGAKASFIFSTGREPSISSLRNHFTGEFGPEFYPATAAASPGIPALAGRGLEAALNTNSFFQNAAAAAGIAYKVGQRPETKADAALRMLMDLAFPRLLSTAYSAQQHAEAMGREERTVEHAVARAAAK
jgi:hypothetical protein